MKANKDGLSYLRSDYTEQDGTHPSPPGRQKVAERLLRFLKTDPAAKLWFTAQP
jgi:lysophospholipase L1-like esterase